MTLKMAIFSNFSKIIFKKWYLRQVEIALFWSIDPKQHADVSFHAGDRLRSTIFSQNFLRIWSILADFRPKIAEIDQFSKSKI